MKKVVIIALPILLIAGILSIVLLNNSKPGVDSKFEKELLTVAEDTYQFFTEYTDSETGLTLDRVDVENGEVKSEHTSPTNIAMYIVSTISASELGIISKKEAQKKIEVTLDTLEKMDKWNGLFYNWYYTKDGSLKKDWGQFISTVDNGWLTAALIVTGQYFPSLADITDPMVEKMDYSTLYDPNVGQMRGGYDVEKGKVTDHHYGMLYSETRLASYVSIGKGDAPDEHWLKLYRTFPPEFDWQSQKPGGYYETIDGVKVYQGHYEYEGIKYVPSWGGSMFEALMPALFLNEKELGTKALGLNNQHHVDAQIKFAEKNGYEAWGFSPAGIKNGYSEFGVKVLGTQGYEDKATVTPHASILALDYNADAVETNMAKLKELGAYGDYGFYDTVNLKTKEVAKSYLSLDQGMILLSITNFLEDGVIRDYFHKDEIGKNPEHLLSDEKFSIGEE